VVFSVDEKSQIQALDRTQPGLPLKRGRCGTMTHDYKRHGTTTLFAALNTLDGTVIGDTMPKHRHQEWLKLPRHQIRSRRFHYSDRPTLICFGPSREDGQLFSFFRQCVGSRTDGYSTVDQSDMRGLVTA